MGLFSNLFSPQEKPKVSSNYKMVVQNGNGFFNWNGNLYQSDIIRSIVRTKAQAVGKAVAKHIRGDNVNPDLYMKMLLKQPNPLMSGQMFQEKMTAMLELNNNAFAVITRDTNGFPTGIYPLSSATSFDGIIDAQGNVYVHFFLTEGRDMTFKYTDLIHLRKDYANNEIFGSPLGDTLTSLMNVVEVSNQGIIQAVKSSNAIRWLLVYNSSLRPEDLKDNAKQFADNYLKTESDTFGVAAVDSKADAKQVQINPYVPGKDQMEAVTDRIYSLFNINKAIIQASYNENQWISFYESQIEPILIQLSDQFTSKLFNTHQQAFDNHIEFESSSMTYASMQTKLALAGFVDRGILSPNEVRDYFNLPPRDGGDEYILRKDTGKEKDMKGGVNNDDQSNGVNSSE